MNKRTTKRAWRLIGLATCAASLGPVGLAQAETRIDFSGFGTLAATHSSTDKADYRASIVQPTGAGASKSWATGVDTKVGAQVSANMGGGWSGVVQVVSDHRYDNSYKPQVEWANLKYQIAPNWYVRAGRVVAPVFLVSDYRNVGYAQTAVRQPYDVYELNPITHMDGGDIGAQYPLAGGTLNAQLVLGKVKEYTAITTPEYRAPGNWAYVSGPTGLLNLTYERGNASYRVGYGKYDLGISTNIGVFNLYDSSLKAYRSVAPTYESNLTLERKKSALWSLGYSYDPGPWLLQSEYARAEAKNLLVPNQRAWYVLAGYRFGKLTPYASFSKVVAKPRPLVSPSAAACGASASCAMGAAVVAYIDPRASIVREQSTLALGTRYDFHKSVAFKAQFEHVRKPAMNELNRGMFVNEVRESAAFPYSSFLTQGRSVNLLTLALDFVF